MCLAYLQATVRCFIEAHCISYWKLPSDHALVQDLCCLHHYATMQKLILPKIQPAFQCSRFPLAIKKVFMVRHLCSEVLENNSPWKTIFFSNTLTFNFTAHVSHDFGVYPTCSFASIGRLKQCCNWCASKMLAKVNVGIHVNTGFFE